MKFLSKLNWQLYVHILKLPCPVRGIVVTRSSLWNGHESTTTYYFMTPIATHGHLTLYNFTLAWEYSGYIFQVFARLCLHHFPKFHWISNDFLCRPLCSLEIFWPLKVFLGGGFIIPSSTACMVVEKINWHCHVAWDSTYTRSNARVLN
jgi:hypothetical protein